MADRDGDDRRSRPTVALDPRVITGPTWPVVVATLEQLAPTDGTRALVLGYAVLLRQIATRMTAEDAGPELVNEAQRIVDILRFMPWSGE